MLRRAPFVVLIRSPRCGMAMTAPSPDSATRARRGKPWTRPRSCLRATAPVLDATGVHFIVSLVGVLNPAPDCRCQLPVAVCSTLSSFILYQAARLNCAK